MLKRAFTTEVFKAADMQRWGDKVRPVELRELDRQAHKMTIAYALAKYEDLENRGIVDWIGLIEGGIFEFLERLVLTDIKPEIRRQIEETEAKKMRKMVSEHFKFILPDHTGFDKRFKQHLRSEKNTAGAKLLEAAGLCSRKWEWRLIKEANREDYEVGDIEARFEEETRAIDDLKGMKQFDEIRSFVDLCGMLRFQERWSHLHRVPRTSVLGHALIVAILSYLFTLKIESMLKTGLCQQRRFNNFFGGLFHDLPEALTRDIISPVKQTGAIESIIKRIEEKAMERRVYPQLRLKGWDTEMRKFTQNEFQSKALIDGESKVISSNAINRMYHKDRYDPIDGEIIKAADDLAAFVEAYLAIQNGIVTPDFAYATYDLKRKYLKRRPVGGLHFGEIYVDF